jgi:PIN domain nuclease of toxin-antitoxin system
MPPILADTHAAVWYLLVPSRLSAAAEVALDAAAASGDPVYVASISLVELRYLVDRGRLPEAAYQALDGALSDPDVALEIVPLDHAVASAVGQIPRDVVPDMPDRIIAASALARGVPLVTRDAKLRGAPLQTIW